MPLTKAALLAAVDNIRGAVMICYPMGLPEWDFVRECLEGREDLSGTDVSGWGARTSRAARRMAARRR